MQSTGLFESGGGGMQAGVGQGCLLFKLIEARISKDLPPLAAQLVFSGLGLFPGTGLILGEGGCLFVYPASRFIGYRIIRCERAAGK
ncbi:hypothetical protein D3C87_1769420 [compost metagenome]